MRNVPIVEGYLTSANIAWNEVIDQLAARGWARLVGAIAPHALEALEQAASGPWSALPETEGSAGVRQAGLTYHSAVDEAADVVRSLGDGIREGIDGAAGPGVSPLPVFNHAEWCRADRGQKFITPHRDPDTAGGVIAVVTIRGGAVFRIWDLDGSLAEAHSHSELATAWESEDGEVIWSLSRWWMVSTASALLKDLRSPPPMPAAPELPPRGPLGEDRGRGSTPAVEGPPPRRRFTSFGGQCPRSLPSGFSMSVGSTDLRRNGTF